ncbi:MAG: cobalt ECF transporter T component CbiQ [Candidatus Neomarinimicrobiota bacterium]|nr:MAG: cobalt ECF transporter T component CbiQ [Candidatus Neomarinimicrobiota bacterium]
MSAGLLDRALSEVRSLDTLSRQSTPVHRLDPRTKLILVFMFVGVVMSFPPYTLLALLPYAAFPLWLAASGRIPGGALYRKLLLVLPLAVFVGILNPIFDTTPRMVPGIGSVAGGWLSLGSILVRFFLNAATGLLLLGTTGVLSLTQGMEALHFPRVFSTLFLLMYRYLFILTEEVLRLNQARRCRSSARSSLTPSLAGAMIGSVLLRAWDRADRITTAMRMRGFTGTPPRLTPLHWTATDTRVLVFWTAYFLLCRGWNLPVLLGRVVVGLLS